MNFIWSYKIADFVQYLLALQKITRLMDIIRSGGVCKISTSLAKIYNNYELYKVWQTLDNIEQPCEIIPDLWTLYGPIG